MSNSNTTTTTTTVCTKKSDVVTKNKDCKNQILTSEVARWRFENLRKSLQTNLPIFGESSYPAIMIPTVNSTDSIYLVTGHDQNLDELCQEYDPMMKKVVVLDDEAGKSDYKLKVGESTDFKPELLQSIIRLVIRFVQSNKATPGHTYWLYKDCDQARVYNLTVLYRPHMECKEERKCPYVTPVAALLYHLAEKIALRRATETNDRFQHIQCLSSCIQLLDLGNKGYSAPLLLTNAIYMFAMWCLVEGSIITNGGPGIFPEYVEKAEKEGSGKPGMKRRMSDMFSNYPIGSIFRSYIKSYEKAEKSVIVKTSAAPHFAHIPLALDLAFRGIEISTRQFDKSAFDQFQFYVAKYPIVLKLINFTKMICTALSQQHLQACEYSDSLVYVKLGLINHEVMEAFESSAPHINSNGKNRNKNVNQNNAVPNDEDEASDNKVDLFFSILASVAGEIHFNLASKMQRDRNTIHNFLTNFDKALIKNDHYFRIVRKILPNGGNKYPWASHVPDNRKQLYNISGQCFAIALAQHKSNNKHILLGKEQSGTQKTRSGAPKKAAVTTNNNSSTLVEDEGCRLSSSDFTMQSGKIDYIVDLMNPFIYITSENDLLNQLDSDEDFKKAYEILDQALKSYIAFKNIKKEILVYAKQAFMTRVNAVWLKGQNTRMFSKREQELLHKAVNYYQRALEGFKLFDNNPDEGGDYPVTKEDVSHRDTLKWNLGDTYYQLANRLLNNLQDMHTTKEMEQQMFDFLTKSIDIWGYFTESLDEHSSNLKVARNRIAESHHMLACQHNQAFLEKDGNSKPANFRLAIQHYQKAAKYFSLAVMPTAEFFSRVGILNLLASQFAPAVLNAQAKIKLLDDCFADVYACSPCLEEIVKNLERVSKSPEAEIQSDENLLYSPTFCQNLHSWFSIFSYIITTIFKHSVQSGEKKSGTNNSSTTNSTTTAAAVPTVICSTTRKLFKDAYDHVLRILQDADLLGIQGGRALSTEISTELLLKKAHALVRAIKQTPQNGPGGGVV